MAAGTRHVAALAADATCYTWAHGAVGGGNAADAQRQRPTHQPLRCAWLSGATSIACVSDYTLALLPTSDGSRVVRWQHSAAADGGMATTGSQADERDAGEVASPSL